MEGDPPMPICNLDDMAAPVPGPVEVSADERLIATLARGELLALKRPEGEGWVSAKLRYDAIGQRLGFTLKLWWSLRGEKWYVVRMR